MEVCIDMGTFTLVFFIAVVAWGNAWFILAENAYFAQTDGMTMTDDEVAAAGITSMTGSLNFLLNLFYSYEVTLG